MPDRKNFLIITLTSVVMWLGMELWFKPQTPVNPVTVASSGIVPPQATLMLPDRGEDSLLLKNQSLSVAVDPQGAVVRSCFLQKYAASAEPDSPPVSLLSTPAQGGTSGASYQYVQPVWGEGQDVPQHQTPWTVVSHEVSEEGGQNQPQLTLGWTNARGVVFQEVFTLVQPYVLQVTQTVSNPVSAEAPVSLNMGLRIVQKKPQSAAQMILHEGLVGMTEGKLQEITYAKLSKRAASPLYLLQDTPKDKKGDLGGWLGLTDKYWLMAVMAKPGNYLTAQATVLEDTWVQLLAKGSVVQVKPGESQSQTTSMYLGPKRLAVLEKVGSDMHVDRLHMAVDFGWFYFLTKPMLTLLTWLKDGLGNFGLAILVMTIGIKGLLLPLSARAFRSMWRMKQLQPKLAALKLRYANDKMKLNQATLDLYKSEEINPLAGLWPMLIQIPIFFSLYKVLFISIEMRHAPFWGWVRDLSAADPTSIWNGFGLLPWAAPTWLPIGLWPVLMGLTMVGQQYSSGAVVTDRQQKIMLTYIMPTIFAFMLSQFPVGLVIYSTWNNLLTMTQQWFMMRYYGRRL